MKKEVLENESEALVIDEIPKMKTKKLPVGSPEKAGEDETVNELNDSSGSVDEKLEKRKSLLKNMSKESHKNLKEWQHHLHSLEKKHNALLADTIPSSDLMIFQLNDDHTTVKTEWTTLPLRLKEVFEEIIYSLPVSGIPNENDEGCYTFSYTDDEYNLSVISIVIEGKAALFYKNIESQN